MSPFKIVRLTSSMNRAINLFVRKVKSDFTISKGDEDFIPLVFCDSYEKLVDEGVSCPREFIIEREDFYYKEINGELVSGFLLLKRRLKYLYDHSLDVTVNIDSFQDWFVGLFRKYCYQDANVHGSSNLLDLSLEKCGKTCEDWFQSPKESANGETKQDKPKKEDVIIFLTRFGFLGNTLPDPLEQYKRLLWRYFRVQIITIRRAIFNYREYITSVDGVDVVSDCSPQAPLSMGFPRQEYWRGLPFPSPGDLPNPGIKPTSPALAGGSFTAEPPGKSEVYSR